MQTHGEPSSAVAVLRLVALLKGPHTNRSCAACRAYSDTQTPSDKSDAISVMESLPLTVLWMTSTAELTVPVLL